MENTGFLNLASTSNLNENLVVNSQPNPPHTPSWWKWSWYGIMKFLPVLLTLAIVGIADRTLAARVGDRGTEVTNIQRCLKQLGVYNGPITGYFGSQTEAAVRQFQSRNGIQAIGVVGPQTSRALQSRCQAARPPVSPTNPGVLRVGSRGDAVLRLQQNLRQLGFYTGPINGNFGTLTQQAVIRFQNAYRLNPDGVAGGQTLVTINRLLVAQRPTPQPQPIPDLGGSFETLRPGDRNQFVTKLQQDLRTLRYFNQDPTGFYGDVTSDAVSRFQRDRGLFVSGVADRNTLIAVEEAVRNMAGGGSTPDNGCSPNSGNVCQGERSQRVVLVQQRLSEWGFLRGNVDGFYGQSTRDAVVQFQRYSGLAATGIVDFQTWQALGLNNNNPNNVGNLPRNNYVVAIPIFANDTLERVRQFIPQAQPAKSPKGDFVNAGAFPNRSDAERLTRQLRDRGFDARVEYIN